MKLCTGHEAQEFYSAPAGDGSKCPLCNRGQWSCLGPAGEWNGGCEYRFCEAPTCEWENL